MSEDLEHFADRSSDRVLDDLGLDEFLAKLKQVTRRTPGDRQNRAALSELSRIDAEIEQLKPSMFAKNVIRAQRSAAPPPPAARSPRNSEVGRSFGSIFDELPLLAADGDCVFTAGNISSIATQPSTMQTEREIHGDVPLSQGINNIQSKILRMQEALKQSRDMRASLVSLELPAGEDIGMIKKQTRTVPMAARSAPPPPAVGPGIGTYGAPPNYDITFSEAAPPTPDKDMDAIRREHNKWRMEASSAGSPQRTPPQLLRRSQILANPHSNQQSPPQMPNAVAVGMMDAGERPMSEQELLVQASHQYQGDPALQKKLWEMVSAGAIRSARELREVAEEQMKQRDVHAALSDMEKAPGHNRVTGPQHGAWDPRYAHQQNFAPSNDYSRPRNTYMTHFRQQPPAPLPLPKNSTRFTQPPAAYYPNAQGMPPAQPGGGGMQMDRPYGGSSNPQQQWGRTPSSRPQHPGADFQTPRLQQMQMQPPLQMQPPQRMQQQNQQSQMQLQPAQMRASAPPQPHQYVQHTAEFMAEPPGVKSRGMMQPHLLSRYSSQPMNANTTPIIQISAISTEEKHNLIDEGWADGEML